MITCRMLCCLYIKCIAGVHGASPYCTRPTQDSSYGVCVLEGYTSHSSNRWDTSLDGGSATLTRMLYCNATDIITVTSLGDYDYMAEVTSITGYRLPTTEVAFHAQLSFDDYVNNGQPIIFDDDTVNIGGLYSPNLGFFLCPDSDVYFFSWSIATTSESGERELGSRLMLAGEEIKVGPLTGKPRTTSTFKSSSTQAVVRCQAGQTVYVEAVVIGSTNQRLENLYTNFLGFILPRF